MAEITRFTPSDLGGQQFTHEPGQVATAVENSFYKAQENVRQNLESRRANERLAMQKEDQAMRQEETAYQQTLRPLREQSMQLGVASQELGIANQSLNLQSAQNNLKVQEMDMVERSRFNNFLDNNEAWMGQQGQQGQPSSGGRTDRVKTFEGFSGSSYGDYKQTSIGYGTVARPGETRIDEATATARLEEELAQSEAGVDRAAKKFGVNLNSNQRDALTSFNYNTGSVERVLERSGGDLSAVPGIMQEWRNAGGEVLPGLVKRRQAEANWFSQTDGTGVPSLSQVVSAETPTGVPLVAAAANSLNPMAVISQSFSTEQQRALGNYDTLASIASTAPDNSQRFRAQQQMRLMDNDPRFQEAKSQREEMIRTVQSQVQVQGMMQSAPDDLVRGFESRYGSKYQIRTVDGRQMPVDRAGKPLNSQDYAAFSRAFTDYSNTYKFDPQAATAELRVYESSLPKIAQVAAFRSTPPPNLNDYISPGGTPLEPNSKPYENGMKAYQTAQASYAQQAQAASATVAELNLLGVRNSQVGNMMSAMFPAPQQQAQPAAQTPTAAGPTARSISQLANAPAAREQANQQQNVDANWTAQKAAIGSKLALDYPDTGTASEDNAALALAARIYEENKSGKRSLSGSGNARPEAFAALGMSPNDKAFDDSSRVGPDRVDNYEVLNAWAEDLLTKYNYLDPKTKRPTAQTGAASGGKLSTGRTVTIGKPVKN